MEHESSNDENLVTQSGISNTGRDESEPTVLKLICEGVGDSQC